MQKSSELQQSNWKREVIPVIKLKNLEKYYGALAAIKEVSFEVAEG
jgi:hypothetical protein